MVKEWTFEAEDLPGASITLDLDYTYSYDPGKFDGLPENCYPPEEEMEINLPKGFEHAVVEAYMRAAKEAIKAIEDHVQNMMFDNKPREWAEGGDSERYSTQALR